MLIDVKKAKPVQIAFVEGPFTQAAGNYKVGLEGRYGMVLAKITII